MTAAEMDNESIDGTGDCTPLNNTSLTAKTLASAMKAKALDAATASTHRTLLVAQTCLNVNMERHRLA